MEVKDIVEDYTQEIAELNQELERELSYESTVSFDMQTAERITAIKNKIAQVYTWIDYVKRYEGK